MSDNHVTIPIVPPSLSHLTNEELSALRAKLMNALRDARRKANQMIGHSDPLKKLWVASLSVNKDSAQRAEVLSSLERELLRVPEAYLAHAYANALVVLEQVCRDEMTRRSLPRSKSKGGKAVEPTAAVPSPPADSADALAAMFDQAPQDEE